MTIRGVAYPTVRAAAKAHGVSISHVYTVVSRGTQDTIGVGMGNWRKPRNRFDGNKINLHGVWFKNMKEASLELGFNQHYIRSALRKPSAKSETRIREAVALYLLKKDVA